MPNLQIRCADHEEARLRKIAEDVGAESFAKWALKVLLTRADQVEKFIAAKDFIETTDGKKIFPDEVLVRPKGK